MRARLSDGRLITPTSLEAGRERLKQLDHHIPLLEQRGALGNVGWLKTERRLLVAWIEAEESAAHAEFWRRP